MQQSLDSSPGKVLVVRNNPGESENKINNGKEARFEGKQHVN
jgi:hypothetical protein